MLNRVSVDVENFTVCCEVRAANVQVGLSVVALGITDDSSFIAKVSVKFLPPLQQRGPRDHQDEKHDRRQS